jgi:hypothetical protein
MHEAAEFTLWHETAAALQLDASRVIEMLISQISRRRPVVHGLARTHIA